MGRVIDISKYRFKQTDKLFLDANFWIFAHGRQDLEREQKEGKYSQALKDMMAANSRLYIDALVASEFINRQARTKHKFMWENRQTNKKDFKRFRRSREFATVAKEIADTIKLILGQCQRVGSGFECLDADTLMDEYAKGDSDFNDQIISLICAREKLKLVTDDGDFRHGEITVLTANKKMLN